MDPPILTMRSVNNEKTEPEQARKQKQVDVEMDPPIFIMISMNNEKIGQYNNEEKTRFDELSKSGAMMTSYRENVVKIFFMRFYTN